MNVMKAHNKIMEIKAIIDKHEISCGEDIYQSDSIQEKLPEIMEKICNIVGYYEEEK